MEYFMNASSSTPAVYCSCGEEWTYIHLYSLAARDSTSTPITLDAATRDSLAAQGFFFGKNVCSLKHCPACEGSPRYGPF
jgi:hypothetical protein